MRFFLCLVAIGLVAVTVWSFNGDERNMRSGIETMQQSLINSQRFIKYIRNGDKQTIVKDKKLGTLTYNNHQNGYDGIVDDQSQDQFKHLQQQFRNQGINDVPSNNQKAGGPPNVPQNDQAAVQVPKAPPNDKVAGVVPNLPPNDQAAGAVPNLPPGDQAAGGFPNLHPNDEAAGAVPNLPPNDRAAAAVPNLTPNDQAAGAVANLLPNDQAAVGFLNLPTNNQAAGVVPNLRLNNQASGGVPNLPPNNQAAGGFPNLPPNNQAAGGFPNLPPNNQASGGFPNLPPSNQAAGGFPNLPPNNQAAGGFPNLPPNNQAAGGFPNLPPNNQAAGVVPNLPPNNQASGGVPNVPFNNQAAGVVPNIPPKNQVAGVVPGGHPDYHYEEATPYQPPVNQPAGVIPYVPPNNQPAGINVDAQDQKNNIQHESENIPPPFLPKDFVPTGEPVNKQESINRSPNSQSPGQVDNVQQQQQQQFVPSNSNPGSQANPPTGLNGPAGQQLQGQIDDIQPREPNVPSNSNPVLQPNKQPVGFDGPVVEQSQGHINNMQQQLPNQPSNINPVVQTNSSQFAQQNQGVPKSDIPIIISWNNLGGSSEHDITCNSLPCHITHNHEMSKQHDVLGILFYGTDFASDGLPLPRKPGHLWSVLHEESPKNNDWLFCAKDAMSLFNLTATFKRESHYPFPTMWLRSEKDLLSTEYSVTLWTKNELRKEGLAPVVFVHNDCHTPSDRSHYMRLLQQYIQIDSYSTCEHNKDFPSANLTFASGMAPMVSSEFYKLLAKYKFAFAFENAICDDYITEKFWRPFQLGVVPLVFGSPKIKDFMPSDRSIIDVRDFKSVKEVGEYLKYLDMNDFEYLKYLEYKHAGITNPKLKSELDQRDYGVGKTHDTQFQGFQCFICEKLHNLKNQVQSGQPVEQWQGKHDHYGCPMPKLFDEEGNYVIEKNFWYEPFSYAEYYLQSLRYHIDNNINADLKDLHKFASRLQEGDKSKKVST